MKFVDDGPNMDLSTEWRAGERMEPGPEAVRHGISHGLATFELDVPDELIADIASWVEMPTPASIEAGGHPFPGTDFYRIGESRTPEIPSIAVVDALFKQYLHEAVPGSRWIGGTPDPEHPTLLRHGITARGYAEGHSGQAAHYDFGSELPQNEIQAFALMTFTVTVFGEGPFYVWDPRKVHNTDNPAELGLPDDVIQTYPGFTAAYRGYSLRPGAYNLAHEAGLATTPQRAVVIFDYISPNAHSLILEQGLLETDQQQ